MYPGGYRNVHAKLEQKDRFPCDYPKCVRSEKGAQVPFTRKDHYRDHLRDFHKEDLGAVKCEKKKPKSREEWEAEQRQWLGERVIYPHYWRCTKCLDRIIVVENGWECSRCKATCEIERSDARKRLEESTAWPVAAPIYCVTCSGRGNGYGEKFDCNDCNGSYETKCYDSPSYERPALVPKEEHFDLFVDVDLPCATCAGTGYVGDGYGGWAFCAQCRSRGEGFYNTGAWP
jgi:RecJ-like exonuclease